MNSSKMTESKGSPKISDYINKQNSSSDPNFDNMFKIMDLYYIGANVKNSINQDKLMDFFKSQGSSNDRSNCDAIIEFHSKIFGNSSCVKFDNLKTLILAAATEIKDYINLSEKNAVNKLSYKKIFETVQQISNSNLFNEFSSFSEEIKNPADQTSQANHNYSSDGGASLHGHQVHHVTIRSPEFVPGTLDLQHLPNIKLDEEGFIEVRPSHRVTKKNKGEILASTSDKKLKNVKKDQKSTKLFKPRKSSDKGENRPKTAQKEGKQQNESKPPKNDGQAKISEQRPKSSQGSKAKHYHPGHSYVTKEFVKKEIAEEGVKQSSE